MNHPEREGGSITLNEPCCCASAQVARGPPAGANGSPGPLVGSTPKPGFVSQSNLS